MVDFSYSDVISRIIEKNPMKTEAELAKRLGFSPNTWTAYKKGKQSLSLEHIAKLSDLMGVSPEWLLFASPSREIMVTDPAVGTGGFLMEVIKQQEAGNELALGSETSLPLRDFTLVPRLEVQASAGAGVLSYEESTLDYLAFQSDWLRAKGISPAAARVLSARGDSMEETIRDGDVLLVDTSINRVKDNSIYIVVYGEVVLVKRIHSRMNGSLQLISDNPRYPSEEVTAGEAELLQIAGRVMWYGRSI